MRKTITISAVTAFMLIIALFQLSAQQQQRPRVVSPEIHDDNTITFRLYAPHAGSITVSGSWDRGVEVSDELTVNSEGIHETTIGPLPSEMYTYTFTIDGVRAFDPSNPAVARDGVRNQSMFIVPGGRGDLYSTANVPHGNIEKVWYPSSSLGTNRRMYVYTPPGYMESTGSYPVLYLLHGAGGDEDAWTTLGRTPQILDNLIGAGRAKPMIVVMTNGNPGRAAAPTVQMTGRKSSEQPGMAGMASGEFEKSLVKDVIPFIEKNYRADTGKESRAVAGLSMGGLQTMSVSFTWPETFSWYGIMSMGLVDMARFGVEESSESRTRNLDRLRSSNPDLYWIACGTEDFLYNDVVELIAFLEEQNFPHTYLETGGGHTWDRWRLYLSELAPLLFR